MLKKFLYTIIILLVITAAFFYSTNFFATNKPRIKLFLKTLHKSFAEVQAEFAGLNCKNLNEAEKTNGFDGLVTAYCQPKSQSFATRQEFLCSVGLNCSCPKGRSKTKDCQSSTLSWSSCLDFNDKNISYCDQTADQSSPDAGQVAADWACFPKKSIVNIGGLDYTVTDKGSAIKGRRFDIWVNDCQEVDKKTGIYTIKIQ